MNRCTWLARLLTAAVTALILTAAPARAGLLPVSVTVNPEAGNFRWTYSVVLPPDMKLQSGDYFTVYDFGGFQAGSATVFSPFPDDSSIPFWTATTANVGPTPDRLNPEDNPLITNITWKYTGPELADTGKITLGNFSAASTFDRPDESFFTARNPRLDGTYDNNITETLVPIAGDITPPGVPEPTTLALAGLGLPLVAAARRWKNRGKVIA